jgi:hypothetical protein
MGGRLNIPQAYVNAMETIEQFDKEEARTMKSAGGVR